MKSFILTLTSLGRQRICHASCPGLKQVRSIGYSAETHEESLGNLVGLPDKQLSKRTTFEDLGLHPPIVSALRNAFPNVQYPTETQGQFIPAILSGKDVLLKDETGSGKSFGLVIALLNKPRLKSKQNSGGKTWDQRHITSLVIVPHRDLAYQFYHWIQRITEAATVSPPPAISSVAQVIVRNGQTHLTTGLHALREHPPHILIGTPQGLHDLWLKDPDALQLSHLSSVVVDEVDYLVNTIPQKDPNKSFYKAFVKANKKLLAHPGVTRELLNTIFAKRIEINEQRRDEPGAAQYRRRSGSMEEASATPQLIVSSATLRNHLKKYLYDESGWLNRDHLIKVKGVKTIEKEGTRQDLYDGIGGSGISHSVLLVSDDGIENIAGAIPYVAPEPEGQGTLDPEALFSPSAALEAPGVDLELKEKYAGTASPFNPNAMEAIATGFALDVPSVGLLVLPSSAPVQRAVYELREMGVNAHGLDLLATDKGREHLLHGGDGGARENPTLLVSTLATTRGLDLPELTHVFILGIPEGPRVDRRSVDGYVHIAGRVGRFGRGGRVISVVEKKEDDEEGVSEGSKMARILNTIGVKPVQFEHFD